jgi:hypothetical protein
MVKVDFLFNSPVLESLVESEPFDLLESSVKDLSVATPDIFNKLVSFSNDADVSKYFFNKLIINK